MLGQTPYDVGERPEPPTRQAIESARQEQFDTVRELRKKLAMTSFASPRLQSQLLCQAAVT